MNFLRKVAVALASSTFFSFLFLAVLLTSLSSVVTKPANLKLWLKQSNIYSHVVPDLITINSKDSKDEQNNSSGDISLDQPAIKQAAIDAFSPQFLETSVNNIVDGTYHWLDGKTSTPDFKVDASSVKTAFANNVKTYLSGRLAGLPACKATSSPGEFDAFSTTCIPRGVNASSEINRITGDISDNKDFLPNPVLTNDTITTDKNGQKQPISEQYKNVPEHYKQFKQAPLAAGLVVLLASLVILFASATKRKGLKRICISLASVGVFLLLSTVLLNRTYNLGTTKAKADNPATAELQKDGFFVAHKVVETINHTNMMFALTFIGLAVAGFIYLFITKPKKAKPTKAEDLLKEETPEPKETDKAETKK